jgi:hypothetical protein
MWGRKQDDAFDKLTNFIYHITIFEELITHIQSSFGHHQQIKEIGNYAVNRWYNFHSAMAIEHIFCSHPIVRKYEVEKDKHCDFYIKDIPFDHKTSVFPKNISWSKKWCMNNPKVLAKWLYDNQSSEQRQHFSNRIFLMLYSKHAAHWKLKAELNYLSRIIHQYLDSFNPERLIQLNYAGKKTILTDLIWAEA